MHGDDRQLLSTWKRITARLESLTEALQKLDNAIRESNGASNGSRAPQPQPPNVVAAKAKLPVTVDGKRNTAEDKHADIDREHLGIDKRRLVVEKWALIGLAAAFAATCFQLWEIRKQTTSIGQTLDAAREANKLTMQTFRIDQRPFIALSPAGTTGKVGIPQVGAHAGHLVVELHLANYGKSPGIEIARDARLAIGSDAAKQIRLHPATDRRGRIIPPGDKPSLYAYSDAIVSRQTLNDILAGKVLLIAYGHIEYSDLLSEPRPKYFSEFCTGILGLPNTEDEANERCKDHTRME